MLAAAFTSALAAPVLELALPAWTLPLGVWPPAPATASTLTLTSDAAPRTPVVVTLAGRIGIDGAITDLRDVTPGTPAPALVAAAMDATRQWEFTPTLLNGAPIEASITVTIDYAWTR